MYMYVYCRVRVKELLAVDTTVAAAKSCSTHQEEEGYYSSYTHFGIHEEMLKVCVSHHFFHHPQEYLNYTG